MGNYLGAYLLGANIGLDDLWATYLSSDEGCKIHLVNYTLDIFRFDVDDYRFKFYQLGVSPPNNYNCEIRPESTNEEIVLRAIDNKLYWNIILRKNGQKNWSGIVQGPFL